MDSTNKKPQIIIPFKEIKKDKKSFYYDSDHVRHALFQENYLFISNPNKETISILDMEGKKVTDIQFECNKEKIKIKPCVFIFDENATKIFVYDSFVAIIYVYTFNFGKFLKSNQVESIKIKSEKILNIIFVKNIKFKDKNKNSSEYKLDQIFDLRYYSEKGYLFASDTNNNLVASFKDEKLKGQLFIDGPKNIEIFEKNLYVLSEKVEKFCCVLCYKIDSLQPLKVIKIPNFCCARGLYVYNESVYTTAYEINDMKNVNWNTAYLLNTNSLRTITQLDLNGLLNMCVRKTSLNFYFIPEYKIPSNISTAWPEESEKIKIYYF